MEDNLQSLNLYPNPNAGIFIIDLNTGTTSEATVDIQIMNMVGQVVYLDRTKLSDGKLQKEVKLGNDIAAGTYFVRVLSGDQVFTGQITYEQ